jgi:peroxiredoxin-like protein
MKPLPHRYEVRIAGGPAVYGTLRSPGVPDLATAPPIEFDGPGDAWSPEQLLLAAVGSCFLLTFRAVAQASGLEFTSLAIDAEGIVERAGARLCFSEIVLRPRVVLPAGADTVRVRHALEKAEKSCLVSASLATPVRVEPELAG